ncbi:Uncharacterised protein [Kluyvera cryocrescens]|uniref:Uncharacterized protein n=1 Tax=Kluyvera cryocrescens TaxID=580 RepID=A0A485ANL9_KLUCR|nr:Uncharacterised protein [Kluyvera cryocrescens]
MNLNEAAAIWLGGCFHWLINKLYAGAHWHVLEQEFDVFVTQTYAAVAYAQADTEVGVSTVDSIQTANVQRVQPPSGYPGRREQRLAVGYLQQYIPHAFSPLASRLDRLSYVRPW